MEMFYILNHWHWWALGALLVLAEILAPCLYFLAIGIAAVLVGLVARFAPDTPGLWQLGIFIALTLICTAVARSIRHKRGIDANDKPPQEHKKP